MQYVKFGSTGMDVSRIYSPLSKDEGEMLEKLLNKVLSNLEAAENARPA